jgi:transposase
MRRGRPLAIEWAAADDAASLRARYRRERRADVRPRLRGLWLVRSGRSAREAAGVLGVHERTVQRWIGWYRVGGLAAVAGHHAGGQGAPAYLTPEQRAALSDEVATGRFRTAIEIRAWVAERWGVAYTEGGMYALLGRLQCAPKVPRPIHEKTDHLAQARWKKGGLASALAAAGLTAASRVGFADELRLGLRGTTRRVWGRRGIKVRQRLQLRYEWRYLVVAVDSRAGTLWWGWVPTMRAAALRPLVAWLQDHGFAALVWDGAPSHREAEIRSVGLALLSLPPYSPELNPAERLFEEVRRQVEGRVYATLDAKAAVVDTFLAELDADPARVRQLCGWDWIATAFGTLPADAEKAA